MCLLCARAYIEWYTSSAAAANSEENRDEFEFGPGWDDTPGAVLSPGRALLGSYYRTAEPNLEGDSGTTTEVLGGA